MTRVGINALGVEPGYHGESLYLRSLLTEVRRLQPEVDFVVFTDPRNHDSFEGWERVLVSEAAVPARDGPVVSDRVLRRAVASARVELLFSAAATAPERMDVPVVLYVMNLLAVETAARVGGWSARRRLRRAARLCERVAMLVAPSTFVQRRLLELLDVPMDKVIVAPLGVSPIFGEPQPCSVEKPYLLVVGSTRAYRNHATLLTAFASLQNYTPCNLLVVGSPADAEPRDWGSSVLRVHCCPAAQLAGFYQHCAAFVSPSLYEGSGVTVLEAMRAGAPIVCGRLGGIPEVAGNAPIYCTPDNAVSLLEATRRALAFDESQRALRAKYTASHAAEFTWEKCAWQTLLAFRHA